MKYFLSGLVLLMLSTGSYAQKSSHPYLVGAGFHFVDFHVVQKGNMESRLTSIDWMNALVPLSVRVNARLNNSFAFGISSSIARIETQKLNTIPLEEEIRSNFFYKTGVQFEYKFNNGYLLNYNSRFAPYLLLGASATSINDKIRFSQSYGLGINVWINDKIGLNFQGSYDDMNDFNDYMHYTLGLVAKIGKVPDKDRDHVPDHLDRCPNVAGAIELGGCPDFDRDGIVDSLDMCPREYGKFKTDGCPDSDHDGIPDHLDRCPYESGNPENNGCPEKPKIEMPEIIEEEMPDISPIENIPKSNNQEKKKQETPPQLSDLNPADSQPAVKENEDRITVVRPQFESEQMFYIIVGSFGSFSNAEEHVQSLRKKGYDPKILDDSEKNLNRVYISRFRTIGAANSELPRIRSLIEPKAWILRR